MRIDDELLELDLEALIDDDQDDAPAQSPSALATFFLDVVVFVVFMAVLILGVLAVGE